MKVLLIIIILSLNQIFAIHKSHENQVILSAGIGNYSLLQLDQQYHAYKTYTDIGLISGASILVYELSNEGMLNEQQTNDPNLSAEKFQSLLKIQLKLTALPCLFCDATIGACANLSYRLEKLYTNQTNFMIDSLSRAINHGWDGYFVDFEPDGMVDMYKITNFIMMWGKFLYRHNLSLNVWMGESSPYNMTLLYDFPYVNLITMDTYVSTYDQFITIASSLQISTDISRIGYGLWTYAPNGIIDEKDMIAISEWLVLTKTSMVSLWASTIPPSWYTGISNFINHFAFKYLNVSHIL
jgi:hypothetical protein